MKTGTNLGSVEKSIQEIQDTQSPVAVKEDCGWDMQKIHLPVKDSKILLKWDNGILHLKLLETGLIAQLLL